jgi:hypothetical protein
MLQQETALYLGPATVLRTSGRRAQIRRPDDPEEIWAEMALAFPYQPAPGDLVLAASQGGRSYVIGVLHGRGPSVWSFPGDVTLSSSRGSVHIEAAEGVTVSAPAVELHGESVEVEAKTLTQRIGCAYQWVKDLLQIRSGRSSTIVEGTYHQLAERTYIRSEKESKVDGEKIYLG